MQKDEQLRLLGIEEEEPQNEIEDHEDDICGETEEDENYDENMDEDRDLLMDDQNNLSNSYNTHEGNLMFMTSAMQNNQSDCESLIRRDVFDNQLDSQELFDSENHTF